MSLINKHEIIIKEVLEEISRDYANHLDFYDMGCGEGERTLLFSEKNRNITGIDSVDYGSENCKKFKFINDDFFNSGLSSGSFDIILSYDVIEHMEDPDKLLDEISRLLKSGGIMILSTPNKYRLLGAPLVLTGKRKFPYCLDENNKDKYPQYWHIREYTAKELKEIGVQKGFQLEKFYKVFYGYTGKYGLKYFFNMPLCHNFISVWRKK